MAIDTVLAGLRTGAVTPGAQAPGSVAPGASMPGGGRADVDGAEFSNRLEAAIQSVSDTQNKADIHLGRLASGEEVDIHSTMIAMQEADIQLRAMVSVRDKVVEAYQQMMSMTV